MREQSGVEILKELKIKDSTNVLDPTLLLDGDSWNLISSSKYENEKYILVYNLNRNKKIDRYAKALSEKTGMKINVGLIVGGIFLVIFILMLAKSALGFLYGKLV